MKKRLLALFAACLLLCALVPFAVFADGEEDAQPDAAVTLTQGAPQDETVSDASLVEETSSGIPIIASGKSEDRRTEIRNDFFSAVKSYFETPKKNFSKTFITDNRYQLFLTGLGNTLLIALCSTLIGVLIGMVVAVIKVFHTRLAHPNILLRFINGLMNLYTTLIRGTPAVVQLFIAYYIVFVFTDNYVLVSILAFGINSGAYVSEIMRAGIMAVDRGQTEAGRSLGLSEIQTMFSIVMPQAFKNILPALGNEFIMLLKDTSIAGYIGTLELMKAGNIVRSRTFEPYFSLLSVAGVYLVMVIGIERILRVVERRLAKSDRH